MTWNETVRERNSGEWVLENDWLYTLMSSRAADTLTETDPAHRTLGPQVTFSLKGDIS